MCLFVHTSSLATRAAEEEAALYQNELIARTAHLRMKSHHYAGHEGPWVEDLFLEQWEQRQEVFPALYLPVQWTDLMWLGLLSEPPHIRESIRASLQSFLDSLDLKYSYFTVVEAGQGFREHGLNLTLRPGLSIRLFCAGAKFASQCEPLPLLKKELEPTGRSKTITVSFQGTFLSHPLKLKEMYENDYLFLERSEDWPVILESSNFTLCPRGVHPSSFRLYESIQLGSVPIYLWEDEKWLPFEHLIDWQQFSIVLHTSQLPFLRQKIQEADVAQMQAALRDVRHMFTYNFTLMYIRQAILQGNPGGLKGTRNLYLHRRDQVNQT